MKTTDLDTRRLAAAIAAELADRPPVRYVDAQGAATYLGVSTDWVYENQTTLGVSRIGDGPRARLRFDLTALDEYMSVCKVSRGSQPAETAAASGKRPGRPRRYPLSMPVSARSKPSTADQRGIER